MTAFAASVALPGCTLATKLGELTEADDSGGSATTGDSASSDGAPTSGGTQPINSGGPESSSGAEDTSSGGGSPGCTEVTLTRTPVSPNVVMVLDKSGSMVAEEVGVWDHDADPNTPPVTRWSSLHAVVETVLTDFDGEINFGAHLVPGVDAGYDYTAASCTISEQIDVTVAAMNKDTILGAIPEGDDTMLYGGTPTTAGIHAAVDHLKTLDPEVPRAILLVTDGAANCTAQTSPPTLFESYDEGVHTAVGDAFTVDGIPTYVVGVGIEDVTTPTAQDGNPDATNTFDRLNELAEDGGKPRSDPDEKFFNTVNQIELAAALDQIAVDSLTCIITLDPAPLMPGATSVELGGMPVAPISDCASESGWKYVHPEGPFDAIKLCGSACGGLKITGSADVTVCTPD